MRSRSKHLPGVVLAGALLAALPACLGVGAPEAQEPAFDVPTLDRGARHPAPQYLIFTVDSLRGQFQRFAAWKKRQGTEAEVRTVSSLRRSYDATDDAERIRLAIRDAYLEGARWALLGGDADLVPTRVVHTRFLGGQDFASGMCYSYLDGSWNADGDTLPLPSGIFFARLSLGDERDVVRVLVRR